MREIAEKWANFVIANLLWVMLAIPLITLPAATAALFTVMSAQARGVPLPFFSAYLGAMRRLWRKATLVALADILITGFLLLNLLIFRQMPLFDVIGLVSRSVTLFVALALMLINLYLWSFMVVADMPLNDLITASYRLVFLYPLRSFGVLLMAMIPTVVSLLLPRGVFMLVTISATVLIVTKGTWPLIQRNLPEDSLLTN